MILSAGVAAVLLVPLVFLLIEAAGAGVGQVASLIDRPLTGQLLWNTVRLGVVVTALCAVIGTGAAWLTERTNLPGRRVWAVLLVVPLAIPDFVVSFGWASLSTDVAGFRGAVLVMTLSVYPLVYLPVAASFRNADPTQEDVARSLGCGRLKTFWRITLGQAKVAILGGCLLVVMVMMAEYGAFEILGYQTFTTEIFTEFSSLFDIASACALSLVLVALSLLVLGADASGQRRGRVSRASRTGQRAATAHRLGLWTVPVLVLLGLLVALALGVPGRLRRLLVGARHQPAVPGHVAAERYRLHGRLRRLRGRTRHGHGAAGGDPRGPPRRPGRPPARAQHLPGAGHAGPGHRAVIVLLQQPLRRRHRLPERADAGSRVRDHVLPARPRRSTHVGGAGPGRARGRGQVPGSAAARGVLAGDQAARHARPYRGVLPGVSLAVTELTATLILVPTGVQTLATQFWNYQQNLAYGQAAPFALLMIAIAAVPSYVLGRFFDRYPVRGTRFWRRRNSL